MALTIQDKAFIAAVAGLDERRPNDRTAILSAYRKTFGVGEEVTDKTIMGRYGRLMKCDAAKDHEERMATVKEQAIGAAAAESAGKLVTLATQEQEKMRQAKVNLAVALCEITRQMAENPALDGKRISLAGLSKFIPGIFDYRLDDEAGLTTEQARALEKMAETPRGEGAPDGPLPLPEPVRQGEAIGWVMGGKA